MLARQPHRHLLGRLPGKGMPDIGEERTRADQFVAQAGAAEGLAQRLQPVAHAGDLVALPAIERRQTKEGRALRHMRRADMQAIEDLLDLGQEALARR